VAAGRVTQSGGRRIYTFSIKKRRRRRRRRTIEIFLQFVSKYTTIRTSVIKSKYMSYTTNIINRCESKTVGTATGHTALYQGTFTTAARLNLNNFPSQARSCIPFGACLRTVDSFSLAGCLRQSPTAGKFLKPSSRDFFVFLSRDED